MTKVSEKIKLGARELEIETGELAKQAGGAVKVSYGETVVLATCCTSESTENRGFFPLTVDYRERTYAAGKIPGGFFKREGKPQEKEIITSRLIDRPIRPLFPDKYFDEVQIIVTVLSSDGENDSDIPAMIGASCAVALSPSPFQGPIGTVRVGKIDGDYIINPTFDEIQKSEMNVVVSGKKDMVTMLEGESLEIPESEILSAIEKADPQIKEIIKLQEKIISQVDPEKINFTPPEVNEELSAKVREYSSEKIVSVLKSETDKRERSKKLGEIKNSVIEILSDPDNPDCEKEISEIEKDLEKELLRKLVKEEQIRVDGRKPDELRQISCSSGILPRTHGSAIFTKGETQSLAVTTLGTGSDQQVMDELEGEYKKDFMLHYNFPPYSVGEVKFMRGPGRREIGHGLLAEKALLSQLKMDEDFPYTIRLVSDILESNGSSSMATVCAGSMALMDAGVPLKSTVAGVGMGIIGDVILTDMVGDEDHAGDMDFKVAGTKNGITAIQMDIKVSGITKEVLERALEKAKIARLETIDKIEKVISEPRKNYSPYAPQLTTIKINKEKIGNLIGPGGKTIRKIQQDYEVNIDVDDDGTVTVSATSAENLQKAEKEVKSYTEDVEPGKTYNGVVRKVLDFGAFVEVLPGKDGLVHISELAPYRVDKVTDVLNEGDKVTVKCIEIDDKGRVNLSRVQALNEEQQKQEKEEHYGKG